MSSHESLRCTWSPPHTHIHTYTPLQYPLHTAHHMVVQMWAGACRGCTNQSPVCNSCHVLLQWETELYCMRWSFQLEEAAQSGSYRSTPALLCVAGDLTGLRARIHTRRAHTYTRKLFMTALQRHRNTHRQADRQQRCGLKRSECWGGRKLKFSRVDWRLLQRIWNTNNNRRNEEVIRGHVLSSHRVCSFSSSLLRLLLQGCAVLIPQANLIMCQTGFYIDHSTSMCTGAGGSWNRFGAKLPRNTVWEIKACFFCVILNKILQYKIG